jgi:nucleotide-binding universal stress UspA family protein
MFQNILVAFDGSAPARTAATLGGNLARSLQPQAAVWVVTVMPSLMRELGEPYLSQVIEQGISDGQNFIQEAVGLVGEGLEVHSELLFGGPADTIIQVAQTRQCDLIVMGTRGQGLLEEILLGSQAQKVISHARCPVLVVK